MTGAYPSWLIALEQNFSADRVDPVKAKSESGRDALSFALGEGGFKAEEILHALSMYHDRPALDLAGYEPDPDITGLVEQDQARKHDLLPLFKIKDEIYVAMVDPDNLPAGDYISQITGCSVEPVVVLKPHLEQAINRVFLTRDRATETLSSIAPEAEKKFEPVEAEVMEDAAAPAVRVVRHLLSQGVRLNASDIHLEPYQDRLDLRYRIDGVLHHFPGPPLEMAASVVARIKIQCGMDIAEKRLSQDGRGEVVVDGQTYDLRVSVIPNIHGEGVVIRIMNPLAMNKELTDLGFPREMLERYERIVTQPWGILLVTGPTGSGKTTTLYATLKRLKSPEKKLVTLEDPVEFRMDGITQIQTKAEIGSTFARGLRAVLRHDPDILMVGEIRDLESADIAVKASLTGHFLFSTLHTNSSVQTIGRLIDLGLEPYQVQASLRGILAQRLLRKVCPACRRPRTLSPAQLQALGLQNVPEGSTVYAPVGCEECNNLGYRGRIAVYELLEITPAMRKLTKEELTPDRLTELGREVGFSTLRDNAVDKMLAGITSLEEVLRMTSED